jgi:hypothetical protein
MHRTAITLALALASAAAAAQTSVGELLDGGAKRLSTEEFSQDVVQRPLNGPLVTGVNATFVYAPGGSLQGRGGGPAGFGAEWDVSIRGSWRFGDDGRVCTAVVLDGATIRANYPHRCQLWFRLGDRLFVADSADRAARVSRLSPAH